MTIQQRCDKLFFVQRCCMEERRTHMEANKSIREVIYNEHLKNWQVANAVGIYPSTLSVWLRTELNEERRERVEKALKQLMENK